MDTNKSPIQRAVVKAGGTSALARACGVTPQAVSRWLGNRAPAERCALIEQCSGVSRYELRPDVFGTCQNNK